MKCFGLKEYDGGKWDEDFIGGQQSTSRLPINNSRDWLPDNPTIKMTRGWASLHRARVIAVVKNHDSVCNKISKRQKFRHESIKNAKRPTIGIACVFGRFTVVFNTQFIFSAKVCYNLINKNSSNVINIDNIHSILRYKSKLNHKCF